MSDEKKTNTAEQPEAETLEYKIPGSGKVVNLATEEGRKELDAQFKNLLKGFERQGKEINSLKKEWENLKKALLSEGEATIGKTPKQGTPDNLNFLEILKKKLGKEGMEVLEEDNVLRSVAEAINESIQLTGKGDEAKLDDVRELVQQMVNKTLIQREIEKTPFFPELSEKLRLLPGVSGRESAILEQAYEEYVAKCQASGDTPLPPEKFAHNIYTSITSAVGESSTASKTDSTPPPPPPPPQPGVVSSGAPVVQEQKMTVDDFWQKLKELGGGTPLSAFSGTLAQKKKMVGQQPPPSSLPE